MFALVKPNQTIHNVDGSDSIVDSITLFAPYTIWEDKNGIQYSPDALLSLTAEQKQDLGIYDVAYATRPDERFYTITQNAPEFDSEQKVVKITFTSEAKSLEDDGEVKGLKSTWVGAFKSTANALLSDSDWTLVRKIERNIDVPTATATYRAAVVTEANRLETAINAATNVTEIIAAVESANFPSAE